MDESEAKKVSPEVSLLPDLYLFCHQSYRTSTVFKIIIITEGVPTIRRYGILLVSLSSVIINFNEMTPRFH